MAEYTPSDEDALDNYVTGRGGYPDGLYLAELRAEYGPEFDRFLARVRRDAAREALDGFKAWRGTRQCPATSPPDPCNRPAGHAEPHAYYVPEGERNWEEFDWEDSDTYRDTHYPETED